MLSLSNVFDNSFNISNLASEPKSMEEITFSVRLNNRERSTLELFIKEHWLAKKLLNNSVI